jgi:hypothetical protein
MTEHLSQIYFMNRRLLPAARAAIEMAKKANNTVAVAITPATTPRGSEQ